MIALAAEPTATIYAAAYRERHELPASGRRCSARSGALIAKEIAGRNADGEYAVVEPFMADWLLMPARLTPTLQQRAPAHSPAGRGARARAARGPRTPPATRSPSCASSPLGDHPLRGVRRRGQALGPARAAAAPSRFAATVGATAATRLGAQVEARRTRARRRCARAFSRVASTARRVVVEREHRRAAEPAAAIASTPEPQPRSTNAPAGCRTRARAAARGTAAWSRGRRCRTPGPGRSRVEPRSRRRLPRRADASRSSSTSGRWNARQRSAQSSAISSVRDLDQRVAGGRRQRRAARAARRARRRRRTRRRRPRRRPPRPRSARARAARRAPARRARARPGRRAGSTAERAPELAEHALVGAEVVARSASRPAARAARAARARGAAGSTTLTTTRRSPCAAAAQRRHPRAADAQRLVRLGARPGSRARRARRPSAPRPSCRARPAAPRRRPPSPDRRRRGRSAGPRGRGSSTYRSPAGPPRSPAWPRPAIRIRWPSAIPAGTSTETFARSTLAPAPAAHLARVARRPGPRRRTRRTAPPAPPGRTASARPRAAGRCPRSAGQVSIGVPGSAPLPRQCSHSATAS